MAERCTICHSILGIWTEDPLKTPKGLAGPEHVGKDPCRFWHLLQIRKRIENKEIELGLTPTEWKEEIDKTTPIRYYHILECRNAIENILVESGSTSDTREELLTQYFNYDEEGTHYGTEDRVEWIDLGLDKTIPIRAIHVEDLRRPNIILMNRWEQQSWTELVGEDWLPWSISMPPPYIQSGPIQWHPRKVDSSKSNLWKQEQNIDDYDIGLPTTDIREYGTGTSIRSGNTTILNSNMSETAGNTTLNPTGQARGSLAYNEFIKYDENIPSNDYKLTVDSKFRLIYSADCTAWYVNELPIDDDSNPVWYRIEGGESWVRITLTFSDNKTVKYGRNHNIPTSMPRPLLPPYNPTYDADIIQVPDGDNTLDIYDDYVSEWGAPAIAIYLKEVKIEHHIYAMTGLHLQNTESDHVENTENSELTIDTMIFAPNGNVDL